MLDGDTNQLLERLVIAVERMAGITGPALPKQPAVLGTAKYTQEEREHEELVNLLYAKTKKQVGGDSAASRRRG